MINRRETTARGVARLQHALAVSALLPAERAVLRMLAAADVAMREPVGTDPVARAAGVLVALLDAYHMRSAVSAHEQRAARRPTCRNHRNSSATARMIAARSVEAVLGSAMKSASTMPRTNADRVAL
jgi:hypothetical protein